MGTVCPLHCGSWVLSLTRNCNYLSSFLIPWPSVLSTSLPWLPLVIPAGVLKDISSVPLWIFQWQMLSQLSIILIVNVDRPLHTSRLQVRQQKHEVRFYPSLWWSTFYRCLFQPLLEVVFFHLRNSCSSTGSTSLSQCCPFLVQMPFRSRLMWTPNGANNPIGSNFEDTNEKIFLWVIGDATSLFVPLHTWRLSSIMVYC